MVYIDMPIHIDRRCSHQQSVGAIDGPSIHRDSHRVAMMSCTCFEDRKTQGKPWENGH